LPDRHHSVTTFRKSGCVTPKQEVDAEFGPRITSSLERFPILGGPNCPRTERVNHEFDVSIWEAVLTAVRFLEKDGFSCLGGKSGFTNHSLLWSIGTYSYASSLFGSRQIAEWVGSESFFQRLLRGERLEPEDIRFFRRNNRTHLTLSLEAIFRERRWAPSGAKFSSGSRGFVFAEKCVLDAIRWDAGEFDD
jgi:hypothetical protein